MSSNYYENKEEEVKEIEFGPYKLSLKSKKEKLPGLIVRKILLRDKNGTLERKITHV